MALLSTKVACGDSIFAWAMKTEYESASIVNVTGELQHSPICDVS